MKLFFIPFILFFQLYATTWETKGKVQGDLLGGPTLGTTCGNDKYTLYYKYNGYGGNYPNGYHYASNTSVLISFDPNKDQYIIGMGCIYKNGAFYNIITGYQAGRQHESTTAPQINALICKNDLLPNSDYTACSCPTGLVDDGNGYCVCPSPQISFSRKKCPCNEELVEECYQDMCIDPCPAGKHPTNDGVCVNDCVTDYCDSDAQAWKLRLKYDCAGSVLGDSWHCVDSYPNADSSDCSVCPPQIENLDGICTDACMDGYPFYYPVSETSQRAFTSDDDGNAVSCYDAGDNNKTGVINGGSNDSGNDNGNDGNNTADNDTGSDNNGTGGSTGAGDDNNGSGSGGSGNGQNIDLSGLESRATDIKNSVDGLKSNIDSVRGSVDAVKGAVESVGTKIDGVKGSVDSVGSKLDQTNQKLDDINDALNPKDIVIPDIAGYKDTITNGVNALVDSVNGMKQNYENLKNAISGDIPVNINRGSFAGFDLEVWDSSIHIDPCPMLSKLRPFMSTIVNFMFILWSVWIMLWGFKR